MSLTIRVATVAAAAFAADHYNGPAALALLAAAALALILTRARAFKPCPRQGLGKFA